MFQNLTNAKAKQVFAKTYIFKLYEKIKFYLSLKNLHKSEVILVHQMGKVGSSSVVNSLKLINLNMPVYHTHILNYDRLFNNLYKELRIDNKRSRLVILSEYISKEIIQNKKEKKWKVITLTREPIARNISAYFQNINYFFPNFHNIYKSGNLTIQSIIEVFLEKYPHEIPLKWLDIEINNVFGIDVFSVDFPKEKGYQILRNNHTDLLVMKLENLNVCKKKAFQEFLGLDDFVLCQDNLAINKQYFDVYKNFRESIILPESYIKQMYTSKYMQQFYSKDEIETFTFQWSKSSK